MNTIDERGRLAAADLRRAMDAGFDADAGLAAVHTEDVVVRPQEPQPPRRTWMLAAAAVLALGSAAIGVVVLRDGDGVDISRVPAGPASSTPDAMPSTTADTAPDASTATTEVVTPNSTIADDVAPTIGEPAADSRTVNVADAVQTVVPLRAAIATTGFGAGAGELAIEDCQECDPARPWAPVRLLDGRALVADPANGRWVVFESVPSAVAGDPPSTRTTDVPWPDRVTVSSQPVVDEAGTIFVTMYGPLGAGGTTAGELWVFDPSDLSTPVSTHPASGVFGSPPQLAPDAVVLDGSPVAGLSATLRSRPTVQVLLDRNGFEVRADGVSTTFVYPAGQSVVPFGPLPGLPDGTAIVQVSETGRQFVDRLYPDGRVARMEVPSAGSVFEAGWVDEAGFLQLEVTDDRSSWDLVHYELPRAVGYTTPGPAGERIASVVASLAPAVDIATLVTDLSTAIGIEFRDDCSDPVVADPFATWDTTSDGARAVFELTIGCDDSIGGFRWVADLEELGTGWQVVSTTEETICPRGITESDGRQLCV